MSQIFKETQRGMIKKEDFENALKEAGFRPRDMLKLVEILDPKGNRISVSLDKLQDFLRSAGGAEGNKMTPSLAREKYQGFDPRAK